MFDDVRRRKNDIDSVCAHKSIDEYEMYSESLVLW